MSERTAGQYKPILIKKYPGGRNEIKKVKEVMDSKESNKIH